MQVIKSTKKIDNAELENRYTVYLSKHEYVSLCAALEQIAIPNLDSVEEEHRKFLFDRFNVPTQKTLLFLATDLLTLV